VSRLRCDARTGQPWTPRQRLKNDLVFWTVRALLWCADRIPPRVLLALCRVGGRLAHALHGRLRTTARENLRRALPRKDPSRLARESFVRAGENLGLTLLLRRPSLPAQALVEVAPDATQLLQHTLDQGRGAVFVSAHLGPFEWIAATLAELGHRPAVVVRESYDARLDPLVDAHRLSRGVEVIHRGRVGAPVRILRALRSGKPVGFLPDLGGRVRSRPAKLLGQRVELPVGPERVAIRARCPVLFGTLRPRQPEGPLPRFQLELSRLDEPTEPSLGQTICDALTREIARCPGQWLWMAPRFH
jgi:KDO2-lipid IV(A) lauroyltransferase